MIYRITTFRENLKLGSFPRCSYSYTANKMALFNVQKDDTFLKFGGSFEPSEDPPCCKTIASMLVMEL